MIFFIIFTICIVGENILRKSGFFFMRNEAFFFDGNTGNLLMVLNRKVRLFLAILTHNDMAKIQLFSIGQCIAFGSKWRQIAAHKTLFPDGTDAVSKLIAIRRNKVMQ